MIRRLSLVVFCLGLIVPVTQAQHRNGSSTLPPVGIEHFLPVHTAGMQPGPFSPQHRRTGVSRPFFLIGCDEYSLAWLAKSRDTLLQLRAFGLVVEASDAEAYRRLEVAAKGLVVRPVPGNLIAAHLGVQNYPAIVTSDGIFP